MTTKKDIKTVQESIHKVLSVLINDDAIDIQFGLTIGSVISAILGRWEDHENGEDITISGK